MKTTSFWKKFLASFMVLALVIATVSVTDTQAQAATKKAVTLSAKSKTVLTGKTFKLSVKKVSGLSSSKVKFKSSNSKVAKVSTSKATKSVTVKGVKKGTATITAVSTSNSKIKATCKVTVKQAVTSVKLNKKTATIGTKKSVTLKATVKPSNAASKAVTWTSSNTKVAKVSSKGVVTALNKTGTVTITAKAKDGSGKKATCKVTVVRYATSVTMNKTSVTLNAGKTATLAATVKPSNATKKTVTWKSSNTAVAKVSSKGVVTAVKAGTATITATAADGSKKYAKCTVKVVTPSVKVVATKNVYAGYSTTITATVVDALGSTVTWKANNTNVAISAKGNTCTIKGMKVGRAYVTATSKSGKTATCLVTVYKYAVKTVVLDKTALDFDITDGAKAATLTATVSPATATNKTVAWSSSNEKVATVVNGVVTPVGVGTATITATADGVKATCAVTVKKTISGSDDNNYTYAFDKNANTYDVVVGDRTESVDAAKVNNFVADLQDYAKFLSGYGSMVYSDDTNKTLESIWSSVNESVISSFPTVESAKVVATVNEYSQRVKTVTVTTTTGATRTFEFKAPAKFTGVDSGRYININEIGGKGTKVTLYSMWISVSDKGYMNIYFNAKNEETGAVACTGNYNLYISEDTNTVIMSTNDSANTQLFKLEATETSNNVTISKAFFNELKTTFNLSKDLANYTVIAK